MGALFQNLEFSERSTCSGGAYSREDVYLITYFDFYYVLCRVPNFTVCLVSIHSVTFITHVRIKARTPMQHRGLSGHGMVRCVSKPSFLGLA